MKINNPFLIHYSFQIIVCYRYQHHCPNIPIFLFHYLQAFEGRFVVFFLIKIIISGITNTLFFLFLLFFLLFAFSFLLSFFISLNHVFFFNYRREIETKIKVLHLSLSDKTTISFLLYKENNRSSPRYKALVNLLRCSWGWGIILPGTQPEMYANMFWMIVMPLSCLRTFITTIVFTHTGITLFTFWYMECSRNIRFTCFLARWWFWRRLYTMAWISKKADCSTLDIRYVWS